MCEELWPLRRLEVLEFGEEEMLVLFFSSGGVVEFGGTDFGKVAVDKCFFFFFFFLRMEDMSKYYRNIGTKMRYVCTLSNDRFSNSYTYNMFFNL